MLALIAANLRRRKARAALTAGGIAVGVAAIVALLSTIGWSGRQLGGLVLGEAITVSLLGAAAGVLLGAAAGVLLGAVTITGPSGSGKSTLLNLIGSLDKPDAGSITVAGASVPGPHDAASFRRHVV